MRYASEDLMNEHEGVLFGLNILEKMAAEVKQAYRIDVKDIKELINFFQVFADKCHHGKEENILFPAMEAAGIPNEGGPIGQMLAEHTMGRQYIADMQDSVSNRNQDADRFSDAATGYIVLMRPHINKENMVLFPMGDKALKTNEHAHLIRQFETYEKEVIGSGIHERLHETLDRLGKKYL